MNFWLVFDYFLEEGKICYKSIPNEIPINYDTDLMNIIKLMVEIDPEKRADSKTIMENIEPQIIQIKTDISSLRDYAFKRLP